MNTYSLYRLAALACGLNALLLVASEALGSTSIAPALNLLAGLFHSLALPALYLRQRSESGLLGGVGFIIHAIGLTLLFGAVFSSVFVIPVFGENAADRFSEVQRLPFLASALSFVIGVLIFSVASLRASVFPRLAIILYGIGYLVVPFVTAAPGFILSFASLVTGVGTAWFGYFLWTTSPGLDEGS